MSSIFPQTVSAKSSATGVLVIPENPSRVAIILGTPNGRTTQILMGTFDSLAVGLILNPAFTMIQLTEANLGSGVQATIQLTDSIGAQQTYTWIEFQRHGG